MADTRCKPNLSVSRDWKKDALSIVKKLESKLALGIQEEKAKLLRDAATLIRQAIE